MESTIVKLCDDEANPVAAPCAIAGACQYNDIDKVQRACSRKEKQVKEAARVMMGALKELEEVKAELAVAHEDNRRLQKAYDKLQAMYEKAADDFNNEYRQRW